MSNRNRARGGSCYSAAPFPSPEPAVIRLVAACLLFVASSAHAALITYTDRAGFLASTGATDQTGTIPTIGIAFGTRTVGNVAVTAGSWVAGDWSSLLSGNEIIISNGGGPSIYTDSVDFGFGGLVYSAGFDFHEPGTATGTIDGCNLACAESTFEITLRNAGAAVGSFQFNAPNDTAAFIGVWSTVGFDLLEIREIVGTDDNEFYGSVYAGSAPAPVPVPAAGLLLASGLGALGLARRRRRLR